MSGVGGRRRGNRRRLIVGTAGVVDVVCGAATPNGATRASAPAAAAGAACATSDGMPGTMPMPTAMWYDAAAMASLTLCARRASVPKCVRRAAHRGDRGGGGDAGGAGLGGHRLHRRGEAAAGTQQQRVDGPERQAERGGDLGRTATVDIAGDDDVALTIGQRGERPLDQRGLLGAQQRVFGRVADRLEAIVDDVVGRARPRASRACGRHTGCWR